MLSGSVWILGSSQCSVCRNWYEIHCHYGNITWTCRAVEAFNSQSSPPQVELLALNCQDVFPLKLSFWNDFLSSQKRKHLSLTIPECLLGWIFSEQGLYSVCIFYQRGINFSVPTQISSYVTGNPLGTANRTNMIIVLGLCWDYNLLTFPSTTLCHGSSSSSSSVRAQYHGLRSISLQG